VLVKTQLSEDTIIMWRIIPERNELEMEDGIDCQGIPVRMKAIGPREIMLYFEGEDDVRFEVIKDL